MAEIIHYGFARTSVAALLVATSGKGLVAVLMRKHPDEAALPADLANRHPDAELMRDDTAVRHAAAAVVGFVERPLRNIDLSLDIRATAFGTRVYRAVLAIPFGATRTFKKAASAGSPGAIRAVGSACARNPIEFAIPWHRVVRSDGSWSGDGAWDDWRQSVVVGREAAARQQNAP